MPIPTAKTPAMWGGVRRSFRKITARNAASAPYAEIVGETTLSGPRRNAVKTPMYAMPAATPRTSVPPTIAGS